MLRRVVRDNMKRLSALDDSGSALVDRRIVVKLLLTYFERDQAHEVLQLMARILGFSGETALPHVSSDLVMYCVLLFDRICACKDRFVHVEGPLLAASNLVGHGALGVAMEMEHHGSRMGTSAVYVGEASFFRLPVGGSFARSQNPAFRWPVRYMDVFHIAACDPILQCLSLLLNRIGWHFVCVES